MAFALKYVALNVPDLRAELCVGLPPDEVAAVRARLPRAAAVIESEPDNVRFGDPFGFRWAVQHDDAEFRSSGQIATAGSALPATRAAARA